MSRMRPEDKLQRSIVDFVRVASPTAFIFSIPNGGKRSEAEGNMLKLTGMVPGIPDLCVIMPGGQAFFMEVKTEKGPSKKAQNDLRAHFADMKIPSVIVRSLDDVVLQFEFWKIPMRAVVQ